MNRTYKINLKDGSHRTMMVTSLGDMSDVIVELAIEEGYLDEDDEDNVVSVEVIEK